MLGGRAAAGWWGRAQVEVRGGAGEGIESFGLRDFFKQTHAHAHTQLLATLLHAHTLVSI